MEFSNPPGRHEREWRHPSEVAAEEREAFQRADAPVGVVLATVGGVAVVLTALTILIAFGIAAPYRPGTSVPASPNQRVCVPVETVGCATAAESIAALAPSTDGVDSTIVVTGTTVATTTSTTSIPLSTSMSSPLSTQAATTDLASVPFP